MQLGCLLISHERSEETVVSETEIYRHDRDVEKGGKCILYEKESNSSPFPLLLLPPWSKEKNILEKRSARRGEFDGERCTADHGEEKGPFPRGGGGGVREGRDAKDASRKKKRDEIKFNALKQMEEIGDQSQSQSPSSVLDRANRTRWLM